MARRPIEHQDTSAEVAPKPKKEKQARQHQPKDELFAETVVTIESLPDADKTIACLMRYETGKLQYTITVLEDRVKVTKIKYLGAEYALHNAKEALRKKVAAAEGAPKRKRASSGGGKGSRAAKRSNTAADTLEKPPKATSKRVTTGGKSMKALKQSQQVQDDDDDEGSGNDDEETESDHDNGADCGCDDDDSADE